MKRFYTAAAVTGSAAPYGVALDGRPLRTPARAALALPTAALAEAIAAEWAAQGEAIDPRSMPLTGLANAAIDRVAADRRAFADALAAYAASDLLAYRAEAPAPLVAREAAAWDPLLAWARKRYDTHLIVTAGIVHVPQPPASLARLAAALHALDEFRLAALHPVITITGSAVIGLALIEGAIDAEAAFAAGHVDELWQVEQWGEDALAAEARASRRRELLAAARLLALLRP
ncbi:ATPase [alpha proteobacterium AAP81b]|nr:ATPase [alpha proteobacterium AAP81b]